MIQERKQQLGKEIADLRKASGLTKYRTRENFHIENRVINSVIKGDKNYSIDTLLTLLQEVGKTIKIIDL